MSERQESVPAILVGVAVIVALVFFAYRGSILVWDLFHPQAVTTSALSAYFDCNGLKIEGQVQSDGKPMTAGKAKLTVSSEESGFFQSVLADVADGKFAVSQNPTLQQLQSNSALQIVAEIWSAGKPADKITDQVSINSPAPESFSSQRKATLWGTLALILVMFFWAFTGTPTPLRSRVAIIISYGVIMVALALPLVAPVIVPRMYPNVLCTIQRTAVGVVVAKVPELTSSEGETQWALNIGGFVKKQTPDAPQAEGAKNTPTGCGQAA